ncbi:hypothetical protein ACA910_010320 [Epithemia clementina (nom. ined.)]
MDLLASLNIDELPEQQTRMMEIMERHPDLDVSLGFNACCTCATLLDPATKISCPLCQRVDYCSESCREQDARALSSMAAVATTATPEEEKSKPAENATGHTSIICSLLKLCQDDEAVENSDHDPTCSSYLDPARREAAQDRIRSELESYPATLANVIVEGPCYQSVLKDCQAKQKLVVHVIGASVDGELWGNDKDLNEVSQAYAEAISELAEKASLQMIELFMFGPECPQSANLEMMRPIRDQDRTTGQLILHTYHGLYNSQLLKDHNVPKADIVVFFNPGFTVPDYEWIETLSCIPLGTPFLSTTNTEMEGIADCQFLLDQDKIQSIPPGLAEMLGLYSSPPEDEFRTTVQETSFFAVNPFCGTRVRQSGTMANDLFVKNRWMLGGIINSFDPSVSLQNETSSKRTKRTAEGAGSSSNTKAANPALI